MGREIKRVALDFDWPLDKTWKGFLNPHYEGHCSDCAACAGTGYSPEAKLLQDQWYGNAPFTPSMTGSVAFPDTHPILVARAEQAIQRDSWFYGTGPEAVKREARRLADLFNASWSHHLDADDIAALLAADRLWDSKRTPTPREVNEWSIGWGLGHDSINCYVCVKAKCERLGVTDTCSSRNGEGSTWDSPENKQRAESWEPEEPPAGEGWQLWETVSEGSPLSPVFATAEELAHYLAIHGDTWDQKRCDGGWGHERARAFVASGWAPTMMAVNDGNSIVLSDAKGIPLAEENAR